MNDQNPMHIDKEDRYAHGQNNRTSSTPKRVSFSSNKKSLITILVLLIFLLLLSFFIFKPSTETPVDPSNLPNNENSVDNSVYQTISPAEISRDATQSTNKSDTNKERIEVPGEVTDILTQKIEELTRSDADALLMLDGNDKNSTLPKNELPLTNQLADNHFTIQITSAASLDNLLLFVKQQKLTNYQIYETKRDNKPWFVVIKGNYATNDDAKKALAQLPNALQQNKPWIKSGQSVKKEKIPE